MTPLDYARKGLQPPAAVDHRSPLERRLDRIGLIVVIAILATFWGGLLMLIVLAGLGQGA